MGTKQSVNIRDGQQIKNKWDDEHAKPSVDNKVERNGDCKKQRWLV